jgi:hypothetical protein
MGYALHPDARSERDTGQNHRRFQLRLDADSKFLAATLLEEWERVRGDLDPESPLFRTVASADGYVLPDRDRVVEGGQPMSLYPTRDLLFTSALAGTMTEADRFKACVVNGGFSYLSYSYQFVRLLKSLEADGQRARRDRPSGEVFDEAHRNWSGTSICEHSRSRTATPW